MEYSYGDINPYAWSPRKLLTYGIERKERRICFGVPGYVDEWVYAGSFDKEEDRDAELKRLQQYTYLSPIEAIEYRAVTNKPMMMLFK